MVGTVGTLEHPAAARWPTPEIGPSMRLRAPVACGTRSPHLDGLAGASRRLSARCLISSGWGGADTYLLLFVTCAPSVVYDVRANAFTTMNITAKSSKADIIDAAVELTETQAERIAELEERQTFLWATCWILLIAALAR